MKNAGPTPCFISPGPSRLPATYKEVYRRPLLLTGQCRSPLRAVATGSMTSAQGHTCSPSHTALDPHCGRFRHRVLEPPLCPGTVDITRFAKHIKAFHASHEYMSLMTVLKAIHIHFTALLCGLSFEEVT